MSEQYMRQRVVRMLHSLDAFSVENSAWPGTPDINYTEGWIELKWLRNWPVRGGVVKIDHFTTQQRFFLGQRWQKGGNAYLLLSIKSEWLLFTGDVAAKEVGRRNREDLILLSHAYWDHRPQSTELIKCLLR